MSTDNTENKDEAVDASNQEAEIDLQAAEEIANALDAAANGASQGDDEIEASIDSLQEQLEQAREAQANAKDDLLRVQAEMQNLRRRTEQDVEKAHKYGQEGFSRELLSVMDNLERSVAAAAGNDDETVKAISEGVELTLKSFADCFKKYHIEVVDPEGEPFDPQLHQAMSMVENPEVEPNTVVAVVQKGYTLHGRVLRPAMVMVSKAASPKIDETA